MTTTLSLSAPTAQQRSRAPYWCAAIATAITAAYLQRPDLGLAVVAVGLYVAAIAVMTRTTARAFEDHMRGRLGRPVIA